MSAEKKKKKKIAVPQPTWRVERGDCVEGLAEMPAGFANLIISDPPYNIGMPYSAYDDDKSYDEYMAWTERWLAAACRALHKHGALWIFAPEEWVSEIDVLAKRKFKLHKRRHVVWAFTFGQASQKNFTKSTCHLLYYVKTKTRFTFADDAVRVPSARQIVYNDPRQNPKGKQPDATWMLLKEQLEPYCGPDKDVWLENRICGTYNEREPHSPNQIPLPIMDRIVRATSNPGDVVLDLFAGAGGLGVAAVTAGRDYLGYDLSKVCVKRSTARIEAALATLAAG